MTYTAHERNLNRRRAYLVEYDRARREGTPTSLVPADHAAAHLRALSALGWSNQAIHYMTSQRVHKATIANILHGKHTSLQRATEAALLDVPLTLAPTAEVPDVCWVPTLGARRRIEAMKRNGWPHRIITEESGVDTEGPLRGRSLQMPAGNWRAIDATYRRLAMSAGPNPKAATWAKKGGAVSVLAWDDIDDPTERPRRSRDRNGPSSHELDPVVVARILAGDWRLRATDAERRAVIAEWDRSHNELGRLTGWRVERYTTTGDVA